MKKLILLLFIFPLTLGAQVHKIVGTVYDQETNEALPFVNITINKSRVGTAADIDGRFQMNSRGEVTVLTFSFVGYEKFDMPITASTPQPLEVYMVVSRTELNEVSLIAGENPAHRIIRNAVDNRRINNPEALSSFEYTSYNKFILTLESDTVFEPFDTIHYDVNADSSYTEVDSTNYYLGEFMEHQHLFLMESVSKRKYRKSPKRNNEKVMASRISGLKNPTFTLLATQLQSFSFYNDFITLLDNDYLNPITKGSTRKYFFVIEDTTITGTDSTFVISFRPRPNPNFDALKGLLYITTDGWALKNIITSPVQREGLGIEIQQKSRKINNRWFPVQMNYDFSFNGVSIEVGVPIELVGIGRTYINEIELEKDYNRKDFSRVEVKISDDAGSKPENFWDNYRVNPLDERERNTYHFIDSIGEEYNFDQKLRWLEALTTGKVRWRFFDIELDKLFGYNIYEGFRLGFGGHTNQKFSEWMSVGGYLGYGFKDKVMKYGYDVGFLFYEESNLRLTLGYNFDIEETGGQKFLSQRKKNIFSQSNYRELNLQQFDEVSNVYATLSWDLYPNLHTKVFANRQNRYTTESGYYYLEEIGDQAYLINGFNIFQTGISLEYAPNDKYMEGPFGRKPIKKSYPVYQFQYTKAIKDVFDGEYAFDKLDVRIVHRIRTRTFGISQVEIAGGHVWGALPYTFLYSSKTNRPTNVDWPFQAADINSFETMYNNEFISDSYVHFMFRQNFQSKIFHVKDWKPDLIWVFRATYGTLQNPEQHRGIAFKTLENGYYETGLELNKVYNGLGLGAYYRMGPYHFNDFGENWSFKLTYRSSFL